jgi:dihydrofolate synthase/folylpolyglutamate synthase
MRELLTRIGDPDRGMPILHVAGTKGKGSTSAMAAAVLTAAGFRIGLFTSPHLERVEERIAIDGQPCSSSEFVDLLGRMAPAVETMDREGLARTPPEPGPTYFEITTAMAFLHFAEAKVDAAVLEVGLGGRLDSTNVCQPLVSVITSISFDHTKHLGDTLEAIAREKAGIIKPGVPVVSGVTDPEPREVMRQTCRELGCRLIERGVDFEVSYTPPHGVDLSPDLGKIDFRYMGPDNPHEYSGVALGLLGPHQGANAAVALAALVQLRGMGWEIPERAVRDGLARLACPARVELIARRPAVVIDAAHNVASVEALIRTLNESLSARRRLLVFAGTQEKDIPGMLKHLLGQFDHVILTQYLDNPRAVPVTELAATATALTGRSYHVCARPAEAWDAARTLAGPNDLICVTGSFFIAAQMRHEVLARPYER